MKNILILFTDPQLAYSSTTLNLFYELKKQFNVMLVSEKPLESYSSQKLEDPDITYLEYTEPKIKQPGLLERAVNKVLRSFKLSPSSADLLVNNLMSAKAKKIISILDGFEGEVIAVDFFALWCAQQAGKKAHLVSLEIHEYDPYRDACDFNKIKSIIIQSIDRYKHLFGTANHKHFIIQNSPNYISFRPNIAVRKQKDLIYCGSAMPWFGIVSCLDFIADFPEYRLTIKGAIPDATQKIVDLFYNELVQEGRLILDKTYLDAVSLTEYVSKFRIGFAFYDFYRFDNVRAFNYYTAPSGKVFQYLNSGVPIVANKLPGFDLIEEKNSGKLIPHLSTYAIKKAIDQIESSYDDFAACAKKASEDFDFASSLIPFIQYLKETEVKR